jgi:membrane protease YdiL (CAAX protease family)
MRPASSSRAAEPVRRERMTGGPRAARAAASGPGRRREQGFALACCAVLAGWNNTVRLSRWYAPVNAAAAGAAVAAALASGLTPADLGLSPAALRSGLRIGGRLAAPVLTGYLAAALVPAARPALRDERAAGLTGRQAAYQALVRIPVGTVLWEETAFRGVLQAALCRVLPETAAIAVTSGIFGVWHVRPTVEGLRVNLLATSRRQRAAALTAGVAATAAGGVVLSLARARSGSLAAPVLVHLATNCTGMLAAWAVGRGSPPAESASGRARPASGRARPASGQARPASGQARRAPRWPAARDRRAARG